jgi:CcmD family protein
MQARIVHERPFRTALLLVAALLLLAFLPEVVGAQTNPAAANPQMRHFWHVFAAYAIAWTGLFGWLLSIVRRIKRMEDRLGS